MLVGTWKIIYLNIQNRSKSVNDYCLKIAEENGEIELELSPLEMGTYVGKFGFSHLALVEISKNKRESLQQKTTQILM